MNKRPDFSIIDLEKVRKRKKRELSELEKQEIQEAFKVRFYVIICNEQAVFCELARFKSLFEIIFGVLVTSVS